MNRYLPPAWLCANLLLALVFCLQTGKLSPEWVIDTGSYANFPLNDLESGFHQVRTFGYPFFLTLDPASDKSFRLIPALQLLLHVAAVLLFYRALRAWGYPSGVASLVATSVLWSNCQLRFVQMLTPDCVAHSLAVMAISWTLILIRKPTVPVWTALGATVFLTYQMRPAYLFLLPMIPLLIVGLEWLKDFPSGNFARACRSAMIAGLVTIVPLFVFGAWRWSVVGTFGLVSFGGYNAAGVFGQFVDAGLVAELPPAVRPVCDAALALRPRVYQEAGLPDEITTSYIAIEQRFDASTWQVFFPAAREVVKRNGLDPESAIAINQELSQVARAIVIARPRYFAIWLVKATARGIYILFSELIVNLFVFLLMLTAATLQFATAFRRKSVASLTEPSCDYVTPLLLIALLFSASKLALVVITTPPLSRFIDPAGVFWPAVLAAAVATQWTKLSGGQGSGEQGSGEQGSGEQGSGEQRQ